MKRDIILFVFIGAVALGSIAVFLGVVSAGAHASVFSVTDESRGLVNMHPALVVCP